MSSTGRFVYKYGYIFTLYNRYSCFISVTLIVVCVYQLLQQCYVSNIDSGMCINRNISVMCVSLIVVCVHRSLQQRYECNIDSGMCVSIVTAALCV